MATKEWKEWVKEMTPLFKEIQERYENLELSIEDIAVAYKSAYGDITCTLNRPQTKEKLLLEIKEKWREYAFERELFGTAVLCFRARLYSKKPQQQTKKPKAITIEEDKSYKDYLEAVKTIFKRQ